MDICINSRKDLQKFYEAAIGAYFFGEDIKEIVFKDTRELHTICTSITALSADVYFQGENIHLARGAGIDAKSISATNLIVDGDIVASTKINCAHIKCSKDIATRHLGVYTVSAERINAYSIFATKVSVETIEAHSCEAEVLEYRCKNIDDEKIDSMHKFVLDASDLEEFYSSIDDKYYVPEEVICIEHIGKECLDIPSPMDAEYTSLNVSQLKGVDIWCSSLRGDYVKCNKLCVEFDIKSQILIVDDELTSHEVQCGYADIRGEIDASTVNCKDLRKSKSNLEKCSNLNYIDFINLD